MSDPNASNTRPMIFLGSAILVLMVLTGVMLLALFSRTAPHPPLEVPPFAIAPFLGASLAIGVAVLHLLGRGERLGLWLALLFAVTALVSFGPQKYFDPAFSRIWPAVVTAQIALIIVLVSCFFAFRRNRRTAK